MTLHELETYKSVNLNGIDRERIVDINDIMIDQEKPKEERISAYLEKVGNPYLIRCGDLIVKMSFSDNDVRLEECIYRYLNECLNERL